MAKQVKQTYLTAFLIIMSTVSGLVACQKKGDDAAATPPPPTVAIVSPYGNCPTCYANSAAMFSGVQSQTALNDVFGVFDVVGDPALGASNPDPSLGNIYIGPVQLIGTMNITTTGDRTLCMATAGQYLIRPQDNGRMLPGAIFDGMRVTAESGASRFTAYIVSGEITNRANGGVALRGSNANRLHMIMMIESTNGQPCAPGVMPVELF